MREKLGWTMTFALAVAVAMPERARAETPDGWEYMATDNGTVVYRKTIPGSDIVAFKGVAYAPLPMGKLLAVFRDRNERRFWVDRYVEHKTLSDVNDVETYWIHFGLPWPVSDRDYVLRAEGKNVPETRTYTYRIKSVEVPEKGVDDCCVRATLHNTYYEFAAVPGEEKTKITVEVHTDPKGSLPTWLVNAIQKGWPAKTLNGLIKHAKESQKTPLPEYATWHEKAAPAAAVEKAPAEGEKPREGATPAAEKPAEGATEKPAAN